MAFVNSTSPLIWILDDEWSDYNIERSVLEPRGFTVVTTRSREFGQHYPLYAGSAEGVLCQVSFPLDSGSIAGLDRCRIIAVFGVGYENVDVRAATEKGIHVTHLPDYCTEEVSDHCLAMLLALSRRIVWHDRSVRAGRWDPHGQRAVRRLRGQTLGLIGFGRVARMVAAKARGFGLAIKAFDPNADLGAMGVAGVIPSSLDDVLATSDFVSIHVPLTPRTRGLIGAHEFGMMKSGAFLINTSRGGLIDEDALVAALAGSKLAGAALDVLAAEPPDRRNPILGLENVILTPHAAYASETSLVELKRRSAQNVANVLQGNRPEFAVNEIT